VRVLSLIHHADAASGVFGDAAREAGHDLVEWNVAEDAGPPFEPDAALVFGGTMDVDQEDRHGWLREELALLRRWLAEDLPVLGVCLGGQLVAKALDAAVVRMPSPEIGWVEVDLTPDASDDPIFGGLPRRFETCQWHSYAFELPAGGVALARNARCLQAYRAGENAWGLQFHAEVKRETLESWIDASACGSIDAEPLRLEIGERIVRWNEIGRAICGRFLAFGETIRPAATTRATSRGS
jgi:GMP synthase-like glutamine amidotransferase